MRHPMAMDRPRLASEAPASGSALPRRGARASQKPGRKKTSHRLSPVAGLQLQLRVASAVRQIRLELVADAQADQFLRAGSRVVAVRTDCCACVDQRAVCTALLAACVLIGANQVDVRALRQVVVAAQGNLVVRCARICPSVCRSICSFIRRIRCASRASFRSTRTTNTSA